VAYNPRTGDGIATHRYANENGAWGESLITHNDKWMKTQSEWDENTRRTEFETSEGGKGISQRSDDSNSFIGQSGSGDVYAGKDGNVYRRDESGWQQHGEDGWAPVEVPDERAAQIDQARSDAGDRRAESGLAGGSSPESRQEMRSTLDSRGFAQRYGSGDARWSNRTYDSSKTRDRYDANQRSELPKLIQHVVGQCDEDAETLVSGQFFVHQLIESRILQFPYFPCSQRSLIGSRRSGNRISYIDRGRIKPVNSILAPHFQNSKTSQRR